MKTKIILTILIILSIGSAFAQNNKIKQRTIQEIKILEAQLRESTLKNDVPISDRLKSDGWVNINPNGTTSTKAPTLNLMRKNSFPFVSIVDSEVEFRIFGETVIVTGTSIRTLKSPNGSIVTRKVRFIRIWTKVAGRWKFVAAQATPIVPPPQSSPT